MRSAQCVHDRVGHRGQRSDRASLTDSLGAEGTALLQAFAENRPSDFAYLKPGDLVDRSNSAFAGIVEWDDFSEHYGSCGLCNA